MIDYTDVGCWIVKGNTTLWDYFRWLDENNIQPEKPHVYPSSWTLGESYRTQMMCRGDLIALWITGPRNPGIYEFGWVTSDGRYWGAGFDDEYIVDPSRRSHPCWMVEYSAVRLRNDFVPRSEMKADPVLSTAEQFRASKITNPSYLDPDQTRALARLIAQRVPKARLRDAKWARLVA